MIKHSFQQRISYRGDLKPVLLQVCKDFFLGKYISHKVIPMGYEDFNQILKTSTGRYFIKMFAAFRDEAEIYRYVEIMLKAIETGVNHPKLYQSSQGYLHKVTIDGKAINLCVMQYIDGVSFYENNFKATNKEMRFLVKQAALINRINMKPKPVYDSWAIINFLCEYKKKNKYLGDADNKLIKPLIKQFSSVIVEELSHCFVHGDIIKTNVMKDQRGNLYIIDFSVSSFYPRIQELAVLLCNMLFDEKRPETFPDYYRLALIEYQKYNSLIKPEINILPLFVKVAHAMHVLCATYEKVVKKNNSTENQYWIDLGKIGLRYTTSLWKY